MVLAILSIPSATALMVFGSVYPWLWLFNYYMMVKEHFCPAFSCYYPTGLILEGQLWCFLGWPAGGWKCFRGVRIFSYRSACPVVSYRRCGRLSRDFPFLDRPPTSAFASSRHVNQYRLFGCLVLGHLPAFPLPSSCSCSSLL